MISIESFLNDHAELDTKPASSSNLKPREKTGKPILVCPSEIVNRLATSKPNQHVKALDEETLSLFQKSVIPHLLSADPIQHQKEMKWCSTACLSRYLKSTRGDLKEAITRIDKTLKWRRQFKPDEFCQETLPEYLQPGKLYLNGFDKEGHVIGKSGLSTNCN